MSGKAEPVDEPGRVCPQMGVDLLVLEDQQVGFTGGHVADFWRTIFMAQHSPTAAPFINGSNARHMMTVTGSQITNSTQSGGS